MKHFPSKIRGRDNSLGDTAAPTDNRAIRAVNSIEQPWTYFLLRNYLDRSSKPYFSSRITIILLTQSKRRFPRRVWKTDIIKFPSRVEDWMNQTPVIVSQLWSWIWFVWCLTLLEIPITNKHGSEYKLNSNDDECNFTYYFSKLYWWKFHFIFEMFMVYFSVIHKIFINLENFGSCIIIFRNVINV